MSCRTKLSKWQDICPVYMLNNVFIFGGIFSFLFLYKYIATIYALFYNIIIQRFVLHSISFSASASIFRSFVRCSCVQGFAPMSTFEIIISSFNFLIWSTFNEMFSLYAALTYAHVWCPKIDHTNALYTNNTNEIIPPSIRSCTH